MQVLEPVRNNILFQTLAGLLVGRRPASDCSAGNVLRHHWLVACLALVLPFGQVGCGHETLAVEDRSQASCSDNDCENNTFGGFGGDGSETEADHTDKNDPGGLDPSYGDNDHPHQTDTSSFSQADVWVFDEILGTWVGTQKEYRVGREPFTWEVKTGYEPTDIEYSSSKLAGTKTVTLTDTGHWYGPYSVVVKVTSHTRTGALTVEMADYPDPTGIAYQAQEVVEVDGKQVVREVTKYIKKEPLPKIRMTTHPSGKADIRTTNRTNGSFSEAHYDFGALVNDWKGMTSLLAQGPEAWEPYRTAGTPPPKDYDNRSGQSLATQLVTKTPISGGISILRIRDVKNGDCKIDTVHNVKNYSGPIAIDLHANGSLVGSVTTSGSVALAARSCSQFGYAPAAGGMYDLHLRLSVGDVPLATSNIERLDTPAPKITDPNEIISRFAVGKQYTTDDFDQSVLMRNSQNKVCRVKSNIYDVQKNTALYNLLKSVGMQLGGISDCA